MHPAPLQLEQHYFTKIKLRSHTDGDVRAVNLLKFQVEIAQDEPKAKRFQVSLKMRLDSKPDSKPTYTGEVHVTGYFRVLDGWPDERINELVETNGLSILYGAIRELVLNLTSRGPWPPVLLTAFTFVPDKEPKEIRSEVTTKS